MLVVFLDEVDARSSDVVEEIVAPFKEVGFDVRYVSKSECDDDNGMIHALQDCNIAYCMGNPKFTRTVFENCPNLKMIQRAGIGVNTIDLNAATEHGVIVYNAAGYCIEELAVHATAMILANLRTLPFYDRAVRNGEWPKGEGRLPRRASNLTVGLFGLGGSGRYMAKIWHEGFGSKLIAFDPYITQEMADASHATLVNFDTLCRESDIISVHAPLTAETYHVFNAEAFDKMKPSTIIANVTRGALIDFEALTDALLQKKITAAGIDTFENEPLSANDPLLKLADNTVLTPHSAYAAQEADETWMKLSTVLPIKAVKEKVLHLPYLANQDGIGVFESSGYTILRDRIL